MTSPFDTELKAALDARAADVTPDAIARVTTADYHPRRHRRRTVTLLGTGGTAALAAAIAAAVGVFGPGVPNAFASWSPHTSVPADGQVAAAEQACSAQIQSMAQGLSATPAAGDASGLTWQPAIEDVRGPFTLVAFTATGAATGLASCLSGGTSWSGGPQVSLSVAGKVAVNVTGSGSAGNGGSLPNESVQVAGSSVGFGADIAAPASGDVSNPSTNWNSSSNDQVALGRVGEGVTAVTLTLTDGTAVQATVANGLYVAWWPGSTAVESVGYTNSSGSYSQTVPARPPAVQDLPSN